jgi:hypothetical protein
MSKELFLKLPAAPIQPDKPVVEIPPPSQDRPAPPIDAQRIRAADEVFAHYEEKPGLIDALGFYAGMMWLGDIARDILKPLPPLDDEPEPKKVPEPPKQD